MVKGEIIALSTVWIVTVLSIFHGTIPFTNLRGFPAVKAPRVPKWTWDNTDLVFPPLSDSLHSLWNFGGTIDSVERSTEARAVIPRDRADVRRQFSSGHPCRIDITVTHVEKTYRSPM